MYSIIKMTCKHKYEYNMITSLNNCYVGVNVRTTCRWFVGSPDPYPESRGSTSILTIQCLPKHSSLRKELWDGVFKHAMYSYFLGSRVSSVGIAMGCGVDSRRSVPGWARYFCSQQRPHRLCRRTSLLVNGCMGQSPRR